MITPKEYIERDLPNPARLYMPEVMTFIMDAYNPTRPRYAGNGNDDRPAFHRETVREAQRETTHDRDDMNRELETFEPKKRHREKDADSGTFDTARYLAGDRRPFVDVFTETAPKPALTIILEFGHSYRERDDDAKARMRARHAAVYHEALKAEAEGRPVRVIAAMANRFPEKTETSKFYVTIKDYLDPIFPEIWGALRTAESANSLLNLIIYTMVGTTDGGNGQQMTFEIKADFPDDEEIIIIDPYRITDRENVRIVTTTGEAPTEPPANPRPRPRPTYTPSPRPRFTHRRRRPRRF